MTGIGRGVTGIEKAVLSFVKDTGCAPLCALHVTAELSRRGLIFRDRERRGWEVTKAGRAALEGSRSAS